MIKGNNPENIRYGSTLATDAFAGLRFDFMLSNPPYGKSWKTDQGQILEKEGSRPSSWTPASKCACRISGERETVSATPAVDDGQLLFLMEMVSKMKRLKDPRWAAHRHRPQWLRPLHRECRRRCQQYPPVPHRERPVGSHHPAPEQHFLQYRHHHLHLGAVQQKNQPRDGKVQLIDASQLYEKLRKNLGEKNCAFTRAHIGQITRAYLDLPHDGVSKIFDNSDFGYYKVTVERPSRKAAQLTPERIVGLRFVPALRDVMAWAYEKWGDEIYLRLTDYRKTIEAHIEKEDINLAAKNIKAMLNPKTWTDQRPLLGVAEQLMASIGRELFMDFNMFTEKVDAFLKAGKIQLSASEKNQILNAVSWRDEKAERVVKKAHKLSGKKLGELLTEFSCTQEQLHDFGYWPTKTKGEYVEYEKQF